MREQETNKKGYLLARVRDGQYIIPLARDVEYGRCRPFPEDIANDAVRLPTEQRLVFEKGHQFSMLGRICKTKFTGLSAGNLCVLVGLHDTVASRTFFHS